MAATTEFSRSTSNGATSAKAGEESVKSANAIAEPCSLVQNTCSTSRTRTVTMMLLGGPAEPHQELVIGQIPTEDELALYDAPLEADARST